MWVSGVQMVSEPDLSHREEGLLACIRIVLMESSMNRAVAITSQNHVTEYFCMAKERGVQWQLN